MPMAKNYIKGSIREVEIGSTGDKKLILSLSLEDLQKIANEKGYVPLVIQERREKDAFGNTHYAYENDYKPGDKTTVEESVKGSKGPKKADLKAPSFKEHLKDDDNPFA